MKQVFDIETYDLFIATRGDFHRTLSEIGDTPVSSAIEFELRNIEHRVLARVKTAYWESIAEIGALERILAKHQQEIIETKTKENQ